MTRKSALRCCCVILVAGVLAVSVLPAFLTRALDAGPDLLLYPTLFERADAPADPGDAAQVLMVGDTSLARGVQQVTNKEGMDYPLQLVAPWLRAADLAVGNYEGVIAADTVGKMRIDGYRLRAEPPAAESLAKAGFKLLNLANNHTVDWGVDGLQATVMNLHAAGIQTVGAGPNGPAARAPVVVEVRGVKIVWLSFTTVPDSPDNDRDSEKTWTRSWFAPVFARDKLAAMVKAALPLGDALIVQFHWGIEYTPCPQDWEIDLARTAIHAGASLVIGHHPHVLQSYETFEKGFIDYSLGNFLFDQPRQPGLGVWIRLDKKGVIDVHGITLKPGTRPEWQDPAKAAAGLRGLCPMKRIKTAAFGYVDGHYTDLPPSADTVDSSGTHFPDSCSAHQNPARDIGQIDMKGDGETEQVTLNNGTLHVFEGGHEVYTSYPTWQVVDAALGDPNQDGRFEVLMLLWKQDSPGAPVTTHPFIVGYRNGQYKVIWGGSATGSLVQAVGIADVNGDGLDELVTIERDRDALPCDARDQVVVTRWNGWGFVRNWASDYGYFDALAFVQSANGTVPVIAARSAER